MLPVAARTSPPRIKICGITQPDSAARVAAAGVDFIGLNFWPRSKRYLVPERAPVLAAAARGAGSVRVVGVFVDAELDDIAAIARSAALDVIQLHGDESPAFAERVAERTGCRVWKAIAAGAPAMPDAPRESAALTALDVWPVDAILLDTPTPGRGGSGRTFDWQLARDARHAYPARRFVLAGGLGPDNVAAAIAGVAPWAIDVASGVESAPGVKDPAKLAAFLAAARAPARS